MSRSIQVHLAFDGQSRIRPLIICAYMYYSQSGGCLNIERRSYQYIGIPMLKKRRPHDRLIFNMGIPIPGKTVFYIETGPCVFSSHVVYSYMCAFVLVLHDTNYALIQFHWNLSWNYDVNIWLDSISKIEVNKIKAYSK